MSEHTPEPWFQIKGQVFGNVVPNVVGTTEGGSMELVTDCGWEPRGLEDARRIVACVNACRGPSTRAIEEGPSYQEMWDEIQAIRKLTDDDGTHGAPHVLVEQLIEAKASALRERDEARAMVKGLEGKLSGAKDLLDRFNNASNWDLEGFDSPLWYDLSAYLATLA